MPPVTVDPADAPISAAGSASACLMTLTRASVLSMDTARVIGRAPRQLSKEKWDGRPSPPVPTTVPSMNRRYMASAAL